MTDSAEKFGQAPGTMDKRAFIHAFSEIYESSPWVAEQAFASGITEEHDTVTGLHGLFKRIVEASNADVKLALLHAHPDLAGRAAVEGSLTDASTSEQAGAGLDQCTAEEYERFNEFNERYKAKFGFPFIMAVKGANRHKILAAFATRMENSRETEFETAIDQVHRIARFRLEAMVV